MCESALYSGKCYAASILVSVVVPALGLGTPSVVMIVWLQSRDRDP